MCSVKKNNFLFFKVSRSYNARLEKLSQTLTQFDGRTSEKKVGLTGEDQGEFSGQAALTESWKAQLSDSRLIHVRFLQKEEGRRQVAFYTVFCLRPGNAYVSIRERAVRLTCHCGAGDGGRLVLCVTPRILSLVFRPYSTWERVSDGLALPRLATSSDESFCCCWLVGVLNRVNHKGPMSGLKTNFNLSSSLCA